MSISPVMSPMISSYVAPKKEEDEEYKRIKLLLQQLGIEPTGSKEVDKVILQKALTQMTAERAKSGSTQQYNPFSDVMQVLELESTGDIDKDYDNTIRELDYRISLAGDDDEKKYYQELRDLVDSQYTQNSYDDARRTQFIGASQTSDLNRYFML